MDEKHFKKHLAALAHGHHHPEEHDWTSGSAGGTAKRVRSTEAKAKRAAAKRAPKKSKGRAT